MILLEFCEKSFVREMQRVRMRPVVFGNLLDALDDRLIVDCDGQLAPSVKTSRGKIDRSDNAAIAVGQDHFSVKF